METQPVVVEHTYNAKPETIWKALPRNEEMKKWYFDLPEFVAEVGFQFEFSAGKNPEKPYRHLCEITETIPIKKISYTWRYDGYEGVSEVTFEIVPKGKRSVLRVTHRGIENFPKSNPDLAKENFRKGWAHLIGTSLEEYLAARSAGEI